MKCQKCGYENKDNAEYCDLCKEIIVLKTNNSSRIESRQVKYRWLAVSARFAIYVFGVLVITNTLTVILKLASKILNSDD